MRITRREALATGGALVFSGCIGNAGSREGSTVTGTGSGGTVTVSGPVANAPIPENPSAYTYATMGHENRPTVTYYGSWKCPYCAQFSTGFLGEIVTDYVKPGTINLKFRALAYINGQPFLGPDAPRAARAGLAVWNVDPDTYWKYHEYVFANQPPESKQWATTEQLITFAKEAGVDRVKTVRQKLNAGAYTSAIKATSEAAANADISGTPTLVIGDETVNPLSETDRTRSLIEQFVRKS